MYGLDVRSSQKIIATVRHHVRAAYVRHFLLEALSKNVLIIVYSLDVRPPEKVADTHVHHIVRRA